MALARGRRRSSGADYWPGFVDAMATLLLTIIFLLSVFMLTQFFLSQEIAGKDSLLNRLNRQISQLTELLSLEKSGKKLLSSNLDSLQESLSLAEAENNRLMGLLTGESEKAVTAGGQASSLEKSLEAEKTLSANALAQIELLNHQILALRRQLAAIESALEASEKRDRESKTKIADLGKRLNVALARKVQELAKFRSDFFGRLRKVLSRRADIEIVGDRFVFQSEVLFDSGAAELKEDGKGDIDKLADALLSLEKEIPTDIVWVLRVDGHTDKTPIFNARFPSNWELSSARAISVVRYLMERGVEPKRLVAAGFGENHPLDPSDTPEAFKRNRRIELKLTEK